MAGKRLMTARSRYWLTLSALLGATVIVVGFAPVPLLLVLGGCLMAGFLATAVLYGQWRRDVIRSGAMAAPFPVFSAIITFNVALLLRGSELGWYLVPILAAALFIGCFGWARKHGPYVKPENVSGGQS